MNLITKAKSTMNDAKSASANALGDLRDHRRRKTLISELGELKYREHQGDAVDKFAYSSVLTELDRLTPDNEDEDEAEG